MNTIVYLLFISIILCSEKVNSQRNSVAVPTTTIDPLSDQSVIDEAWIEDMIVAPATINLLGQVMVVADIRDVSLQTYLPNYKFNYTKYPESLRATLIQISNGIDSIFFALISLFVMHIHR